MLTDVGEYLVGVWGWMTGLQLCDGAPIWGTLPRMTMRYCQLLWMRVV